MMKNKGKLIRWNADRGFGFIKSPDMAEDIFIHISELKMMSRSPRVNDVIFFDLLDGKAGKKKAINATIEGVSLKLATRSEKKPQKIHVSSSIISFIVISVAVFAAYKTYPKWSNEFWGQYAKLQPKHSADKQQIFALEFNSLMEACNG